MEGGGGATHLAVAMVGAAVRGALVGGSVGGVLVVVGGILVVVGGVAVVGEALVECASKVVKFI